MPKIMTTTNWTSFVSYMSNLLECENWTLRFKKYCDHLWDLGQKDSSINHQLDQCDFSQVVRTSTAKTSFESEGIEGRQKTNTRSGTGVLEEDSVQYRWDPARATEEHLSTLLFNQGRTYQDRAGALHLQNANESSSLRFIYCERSRRRDVVSVVLASDDTFSGTTIQSENLVNFNFEGLVPKSCVNKTS